MIPIPHNIGRIYNAIQDVASTGRRTEAPPSSRLEMLDVRLERMSLMIQTLLMILLEKKVIHEDEFREWLVYVDELDGARDGRVREQGTPVICPQCNRNNPHLATKCIYCGQPFEVEFLHRRPPQGEPETAEPPEPPTESS